MRRGRGALRDGRREVGAASTREGKSGPVQVASDKDEVKRAGRLVEAIARLVAERDEHTDAASQQQQAATVPGTASAAPGYAPSYAPAS